MRQLNKPKAFFNHMNLRNKVFLTYSIVGIIAVILLMAFLKMIIGEQLLRHEHALLTDALDQSVNQIERQVDDTQILAELIYNDADIMDTCNLVYNKYYFLMYTKYRDIIEPKFTLYKTLDPKIKLISIYTSTDIYPYKKMIDDIDNISDSDWFAQMKDSLGIHWILDQKEDALHFAAVRKLQQTVMYPFTNYLFLEYDYDKFFLPLQSINTDSYGTFIVSDTHEIIYEFDTYSDPKVRISANDFLANQTEYLEELSSSYLFISSDISNTNWKLYYYRPLSAIKKTVNQTVFLEFILIAVIFLTLFFSTFMIVDNFLKPLPKLVKSIGSIGTDDESIHSLVEELDRNDEISLLIRAFNKMLLRIRRLIDKVYVQQLKMRDYQLKVLKAQINPHFLYNTLSLINARAIISEQHEISETAQLLSRFYRLSLNHGEDMTTIGKELENIQTYIAIQQIITSNAFDVVYTIDNTLMERRMPNLILQPLVENAIEHGIRNSYRNKCLLTIVIKKEADDTCIYIKDNGTGMTTEKVAQLITHESSGFGVKNVDEILRLSCGDSCGLIIDSQMNKGTVIKVKIPENYNDINKF